MRSASISSALVVVGLCVSTSAATLVVDANGGADYRGIQTAIDAARDGDTVLVRAGKCVIREPIDFNRLHNPLVPSSPPVKNLTLRSERGAAETTIQMSETPLFPSHPYTGLPARVSVVAFQSGETDASVLDGFTLTGGKGFDSWCTGSNGGGVYCARSIRSWRSPRNARNGASLRS